MESGGFVLVPELGTGRTTPLRVREDVVTTIGRSSETGISDLSISRAMVKLRIQSEGDKRRVIVKCVASLQDTKGLPVENAVGVCSAGGEVFLATGQELELSVGESFSFCGKYSFRLERENASSFDGHTQPVESTSSASSPRPKKRARPADSSSSKKDSGGDGAGASSSSSSSSSSKKDSGEDKAQEKYQLTCMGFEEHLTCSICFGLLVKAVTTQCNHLFCAECIRESQGERAECPVCRAKVASLKEMPLVDGLVGVMVEKGSVEEADAAEWRTRMGLVQSSSGPSNVAAVAVGKSASRARAARRAQARRGASSLLAIDLEQPEPKVVDLLSDED